METSNELQLQAKIKQTSYLTYKKKTSILEQTNFHPTKQYQSDPIQRDWNQTEPHSIDQEQK